MLTPLLGVLGFPVAHSRSPAMQEAALRSLGLDWRYLRLPVSPALFEETARALPASGFVGANVTIPHKNAALRLADDASAAAAAIGAANTLCFRDGRVECDNTDAGGLLDSLPSKPRGLRALVLGAGGTGRAAAWALREAGAGEVAVWNRTPERALELARELGVRHAPHSRERCDLLVNATSVGLDPSLGEDAALAQLGLDEREPPELVVDFVYGERPTPVVAWATRGGAQVVDGIELLVRQGARSFERWTGRSPPLEEMRAAARGG